MEDISKIIPPGSNTAYNVRDAQARTDIAGKVSDNPTFSEASTRANIASGESISTLFGKIKKFFSDLKTVAFTGSYNDLSNKPTIPTYESKSAVSGGTDVSLVTTGEKYDWNTKSVELGITSTTAYYGDKGKTAYDHSQTAHARTDATKTEASSTNGKIKINGTDTTVYTHPGSGTNPHGTTASDVGLGNVGNFKAVSTVANQGLSTTEKSNARANIGAGTSSFSGSYSDLTSKPTLGTAAAKDVASSGNASTSQVVMGNDTRLSDSRNAADVYSWAKASTKPTYTASEVGLGNVGNFKAVSTVASQGLSDTEKSNARTNIGAGTSSFSGSYNDLTNKPTIPVKALWVDMGTISSLPTTKTASGCQTDMVCAKAELGTPSAQTGTWTINTDTAGKVTVSGTISGSTTLKLLLVPEDSVTAT